MNEPNIVVIGSLNMDLVTTSYRFPQKGETIIGTGFKKVSGGKGANQAVSLARLGAKVSIIGCVGKDIFGKELVSSMKKEGINISGIKVLENASTGIASIVVAEGDNNIIVIPGANKRLNIEDIDKNEEIIKTSDLVILQLEIPIDIACYAIEKAKKYNKKVILNPAPAGDIPKYVYKYIDYITPNETELGLLTGVDVKDEASLKLAMKQLTSMGVGNIITTLGSKGASCLTDREEIKKYNSFKVNVVDTTGAGDAFNGGLAYSLAKGLSLNESIIFANKVSAISVTRFGAQSGMPYLKEVEGFSI